MNVASQTNGIELKIEGLYRKINNQVILDHINFEVHAGETFVIIGPSGSGKTMLLKHIIGLEKPDGGDVLLNGDSIFKPDTRDRYRLAMVFQSSALLNSLTVGQNVGLYLTEHNICSPAEIKKIVSEKLEIMGLKGLEDKYPSELSGGMKKRVAIARALVSDPQLILYDEPTSELDPIMAVNIAREIQKLKHRIKATSLIVTHDRDLAYGIADRIGIMKNGRMIAIGSKKEIMESNNPEVVEFLNIDFQQLKIAQ
jgi:phospholipid/cholesterol/gamma-HCH transport system ATP-binding protein